MSLLIIFGIALGLAMDTFAIGIVTGAVLPRLTFHHFFRLSFYFGFFQFMMPILGWWAGRTIATQIEAYDHWVAFGLLAFIGGRMIKESFSKKEREHKIKDPTRGLPLLLLSLATSIDALAIGLSLAMLHVDIWLPSVIIGLVTAAMTCLGLALGLRLGKRFGKHMEQVGGLVLIGIGIKILISHVAA